MRIDTRVADDMVTVSVRGDVDMVSAGVLDEAMTKIAGTHHVALDLAGVDFMDSSALTVIVIQAMRLTTSGGSLRIRHPSVPVRRLLDVAQLEGLIEPNAA